jgi:hypothetical protein
MTSSLRYWANQKSQRLIATSVAPSRDVKLPSASSINVYVQLVLYSTDHYYRLHLNCDQVEANIYLLHCHISILLYRSCSCCSLRRQGRANIFVLSLRAPPIASESSGFSQGLFRKCRVGHFGETNPMLSNAGTSARSPLRAPPPLPG